MEYKSAETKKLVDELLDAQIHLISTFAMLGHLPTGSDMFLSASAASFIKTLEFAILCTVHRGDGAHPFFLTSNLRGICEDVIVLSWLKSCDPDDRSSYLVATAALAVLENLKRQADFFDTAGTGQILMGPESFAGDPLPLEATLIQLRKKYKWPKRRDLLPSVRWCAVQQGFTPLYDYLYAGASQAVHFSPVHLFRSGLGTEYEDGQKVLFSTGHNRAYYETFNLVYSAHLVVIAYRTLGDVIDPQGVAEAHVTRIETWTTKIRRWPELVTFEDFDEEYPSR